MRGGHLVNDLENDKNLFFAKMTLKFAHKSHERAHLKRLAFRNRLPPLQFKCKASHKLLAITMRESHVMRVSESEEEGKGI